MKEESKAEQIISVLNDRGGFDDWWGNIDKECQDEILDEIKSIIKSEDFSHYLDSL